MALSLTESTDCGVSKLNASLTFGSLSNMSFDAESAEFPWMASLQIRGNHFCGGAIIGQRWVLTAAHCALLMIKFNIYLSDTSLNKYAIIVGVIDRTDRRFKYNVEKVVINDCFNIHGIGFDDIALLRTDRDIDFITTEDNSYLINSICLPKGDPIDYKVFFSGWGQYSEYDGPVIDQPKFLKKTVQRLSDMEVCRVAMLVISGGLSFASIDNLCVGNSDSSACYGDSGGPLIQMVNKRWHVLGVASFTINSCNFEDPVIYTKVSHYREWIGLAINYSNTNDQNFIYFGCNQFVIFHELKPLVHYFRSFVTRLSLAKDYFHNLA